MYSTHGQNARRSQPATAHSGSPTMGSQDRRHARGPKRSSQRSARGCAALAIVRDAFVRALRAVAHPEVMAPPTVLPAVATSTAGQNRSGLSLTSPNTAGSEPIGSSVAETSATTKTVLSPILRQGERGQQGGAIQAVHARA